VTRLRVILVAPPSRGAPTGNEISVRRLERALASHGHDVRVTRPADIESRRLADPSADLVHAFHARRTGPAAAELAEQLRVPLVVTLTGTDVDLDVHDAERACLVRDVLCRAAAIVCGHEGARDTTRTVTGRDDHVFVVPKGVSVPETLPVPAFPPVAGRMLVLQVAHLRPVKNNLLAVEAVRRLEAEGVAIDLRLLGDILDEDYAAELARASGGVDAWERIWHPAVSHDEVGHWYAAADVVLNTSDGEGGSNAILEAMAHGVAVLASAIPGNLAYAGADETRGLTYPVTVSPNGQVQHDAEALCTELRRLAADPGLRARLGAAGRQWVSRRHSGESELRGVLAAYAHASATAG